VDPVFHRFDAEVVVPGSAIVPGAVARKNPIQRLLDGICTCHWTAA